MAFGRVDRQGYYRVEFRIRFAMFAWAVAGFDGIVIVRKSCHIGDPRKLFTVPQMESFVTLCGEENVSGLGESAKIVMLFRGQGAVALYGASLLRCLPMPADAG